MGIKLEVEEKVTMCKTYLRKLGGIVLIAAIPLGNVGNADSSLGPCPEEGSVFLTSPSGQTIYNFLGMRILSPYQSIVLASGTFEYSEIHNLAECQKRTSLFPKGVPIEAEGRNKANAYFSGTQMVSNKNWTTHTKAGYTDKNPYLCYLVSYVTFKFIKYTEHNGKTLCHYRICGSNWSKSPPTCDSPNDSTITLTES